MEKPKGGGAGKEGTQIKVNYQGGIIKRCGELIVGEGAPEAA